MREHELDPPHRNPAIERMMAMLNALEQNPGGLGLKALTQQTGVTRSTVYRILNSLEAHGMVRQVDGALYVLGSRILSLADGVTLRPENRGLVRAAQVHLNRVASSIGESCKMSVYDRGSVLVVAIAPGSKAQALHSAVGQHLPIHAGAGSKILLAYLETGAIEAILGTSLRRYTENTLTEPRELWAELALIRRQGWARDHGEFAVSINAYAAPVIDRNGQIVAALSVPFLAGRAPEYEQQIKVVVCEAATAISADLI